MHDRLSIQVRWIDKKRKLNLEGGTVFDGFPSAGLVNAIATECLIRSLKTELMAVLDSPEFPPLSVVTDSCPKFPARVYVNEPLKATFFISELEIYPPMQKAAANIILQWTMENQCKTVLSSAGIIAKDKDQISGAAMPESSTELHALGSTDTARSIITKNGFEQFRAGTISGIPATLLNEGSIIGLDVIVLLVKTSLDGPDFRAAALLSQAVTKLVPGIYCDVGTMIREGEAIENNFKAIRYNHRKISAYR